MVEYLLGFIDAELFELLLETGDTNLDENNQQTTE